MQTILIWYLQSVFCEHDVFHSIIGISVVWHV